MDGAPSNQLSIGAAAFKERVSCLESNSTLKIILILLAYIQSSSLLGPIEMDG
jgi:hypothetical protein